MKAENFRPSIGLCLTPVRQRRDDRGAHMPVGGGGPLATTAPVLASTRTSTSFSRRSMAKSTTHSKRPARSCSRSTRTTRLPTSSPTAIRSASSRSRTAPSGLRGCEQCAVAQRRPSARPRRSLRYRAGSGGPSACDASLFRARRINRSTSGFATMRETIGSRQRTMRASADFRAVAAGGGEEIPCAGRRDARRT
jgi:hypothetical protein